MDLDPCARVGARHECHLPRCIVAHLRVTGWFIALPGVMGGVVGEQGWSLRGKGCVVTGANSGIGQEVSLRLARLGGSVLLLCRRPAEGEKVRQSILARQPGAVVSVATCDVGDFGSIRRAAAQILSEWRRLDVLVHNAGATFPQRTMTWTASKRRWQPTWSVHSF